MAVKTLWEFGCFAQARKPQVNRTRLPSQKQKQTSVQQEAGKGLRRLFFRLRNVTLSLSLSRTDVIGLELCCLVLCFL